MTYSIWPTRYLVRLIACTLKMTDHWLLNLKLLKNNVSAVGLHPALLAPLASLALKVFLNTTQIYQRLRPVTHYNLFFRFSCFHNILEYLPWLQNDVKTRRCKNPKTWFFSQSRKAMKKWCENKKMRVVYNRPKCRKEVGHLQSAGQSYSKCQSAILSGSCEKPSLKSPEWITF